MQAHKHMQHHFCFSVPFAVFFSLGTLSLLFLETGSHLVGFDGFPVSSMYKFKSI